MNEMNQFENQLRAWAPRRPSPKLEARIFGTAQAQSPASLSHPWLAPAFVCGLLLLAVTGQRSFVRTNEIAGGTGLFAMILSNQSVAAYLPGSFDQGQNVPRPDSFEWTNGTRSGSTIGSLQPTKSNNQD